MRILQRRRQRQGPNRLEDGGGRRKGRTSQAGRHHHRADVRKHR